MKGIVVLGGPSVLVLGDSVSEPDMYLAALWPGQGGLRWSVSLSPWTQLNINVRSSHEAPVTSQRIFPVMRHTAVMSHCTPQPGYWYPVSVNKYFFVKLHIFSFEKLLG